MARPKGIPAWNKGIKTGLVPRTAFQKGRTLPVEQVEKNRKLLKERWESGEFTGTRDMKFSEATKRKMSDSQKKAKTKKQYFCLDCEKKISSNAKTGRCLVCAGVYRRYAVTKKDARHEAMSRREYKIWREAVFARDNWTCVSCSKTQCYLEADHIKSWAQYPELRYAIDNGRTLCKPCHMETETYPVSLKGVLVN